MKIDDAPKDTIRTNSGIYINVFDTKPEMICIEDIAHALSRLPRFGGHLNRHYSVAQHSVLSARRAKNKKDKKAALMHDASEAYILDMPTPIKARLLDYKEHENTLMCRIFDKFGIASSWPLNKNIKKIDREMLLLEWDALVINNDKSFKCWGQKKAKRKFLKMYEDLFK